MSRSCTTNLLHLPNEILLLIAETVENNADLNALSRTNHRLYDLFGHLIYRNDAFYGSALLWAAHNDRKATLERALAEGACTETTGMKAHSRCTLEQSECWVKCPRYHIQWADPQGKDLLPRHDITPLQIAIAQGHEEVARILIEKGANVRYSCSRNLGGCTALHIAAAKGLPSIIKLIIEKGADLEARNAWGQTPLHYAAKYRSNHCKPQDTLEVVSHLIDAGASCFSEDRSEASPKAYWPMWTVSA